MIYETLSRAERSARYLSLRGALQRSGQTDSQQAASAALAETVAFFGTGANFPLSELFALAEAIQFRRDEVVGITGLAEYDAASIHADETMKRLALGLAGAYRNSEGKWIDGSGHISLVSFEALEW